MRLAGLRGGVKHLIEFFFLLVLVVRNDRRLSCRNDNILCGRRRHSLIFVLVAVTLSFVEVFAGGEVMEGAGRNFSLQAAQIVSSSSAFSAGMQATVQTILAHPKHTVISARSCMLPQGHVTSSCILRSIRFAISSSGCHRSVWMSPQRNSH